MQIAQIEAQQFNTGKILVNNTTNPDDRVLAWIGEWAALANQFIPDGTAPAVVARFTGRR